MTDRWEDVIHRPSRVRTRWTPSRYAVREVVRFERRHGAAHLHLACHAALPSVVTPELVNLVRLNFLDRADVAWMAEVDFLLSPLCRELESEEGIYQVEPAIREVLLAELEQQFGWSRLEQVARFLHAYVQATPAWRRRRDYSDVHRWIALAYLNPQGTAEDLQRELETSVAGNLNRWESMARQTELVTLVEQIAEPLVRSVPANAFGRLAGCARLVAHRVYETEPGWSVGNEEIPSATLDTVPQDLVAQTAVGRWWYDSVATAAAQAEAQSVETQGDEKTNEEITFETAADGKGSHEMPPEADRLPGDEIAPGVRLEQRLPSGDDPITTLASSQDGQRLALATAKHEVQLWAAGETAAHIRLKTAARHLVWHPAGKHLAIASDSGELTVFKVPSGRIHYQIFRGSSPDVRPSWSADGELLATANKDVVFVWDHKTEGKLVHELELKGRATALSWSPDRHKLAIGLPGGVAIFDARQWTELNRHDVAGVQGLFWLSDGRTLVAWFRDGARLWDVDTGQVSFEWVSGRVVACALSQNMYWLAAQSQDGMVALWNTRDGRQVATLHGQMPSSNQCLVDFIGSEQLATLDAAGRVAIWSLNPRRFQATARESHYQQARVLVMGPPGSGKTTLIRALSGQSFVPGKPQPLNAGETVVDVSSLVPSRPAGTVRELMFVEVPATTGEPWSNSFLADGADAVLFVPKPRSENDSQLDQWLQWFSHQFPTDSPPVRILVARYTDQSSAGLERLLESGAGTHFDVTAACSARSGEGVDELREMIARALPWQHFPIPSFAQRRAVVEQLTNATHRGTAAVSLSELGRLVNRSVPAPAEVIVSILQRLPTTCVVLPRQDLVLVPLRPLQVFLGDLYQMARSQPDGLPYVANDQALSVGLLAAEPGRESVRQAQGDAGSRQSMLQAVLRELEQRGQMFRLVVHQRGWLVFPELLEDVAEERTELWGDPTLRFAGSARAVLLAILVFYSSQDRFRINERQRNSGTVWDNEGPNMFVVSIADTGAKQSGRHDLYLATDATPEMMEVFRREVEDCVRQVAQPESVVSLANDSIIAVPGMAIYNRTRQPREASTPVTCSLGAFVRLKDGRVALLTVGSRLHGQPGDEIVAAREHDRLLARLERTVRPDKAGDWTRVDAAIAVLEPNVRPQAAPNTPQSSRLADTALARLGDEVLAPSSSASRGGIVDALHVRVKSRGQPDGFGLRDAFSIRSGTKEPFASPQDAGTLVVRADGAVLGMVVATSDTAALACPIQAILEEFQCELIMELPSDE